MDNSSSYQAVFCKYDRDTAALLSQIDSDIQQLYGQARETGHFNPQQMQLAAAPLLKFTAKRKCISISSIWLTVAIAVCVITSVMCYEPSYRLACAYARLLFIKTLPYWDWTTFYKEECLIKNPYHQTDEGVLFEEDCQTCEQVDKILHMANVSQLTMSDKFLKHDIPVIVTDATDDWPARRLFTLKFLHDLYQGEGVLRKTPPCYFASSIYGKNLNIRKLLAEVYSGETVNWYAHWENCDMSTVRLMRRFYRRPYFIPPMVEAIDRNWLILSSGYSAKHYKPIHISSSMMWMAQLRGENKIRLIPRYPCNNTCAALYAVLHEGETVVWTDFLWTLEYLPLNGGSHFNVAVASGGTFD